MEEKEQVKNDKAINHVRNFELDHKVSFQRHEAFRLRQINVAVLLNSNTPAVKNAEAKQFGDAVESLLRNAAGINIDRGDHIEVRLLPFSTSSEEESHSVEAPPAQTNTFGLSTALILVIGAAGFTLITVLFIWQRRKGNKQKAIEKETALLDTSTLNSSENNAATDKGNQASDRVRDCVDSNPDQIAIILERWMKEGEQ